MKRIIVLALLCAVCWAAWTPGAAAQSAGVHATVDGGDADRVHLRASPSAQADSKGLYFTGTQVFCPQGVSQGWTRVVAGAEEGYMMTSYLRTDGASVQPRQPQGVVRASGWVNLRGGPSLDAQALARLEDGDGVTILGETAGHWYYCTAGGVTGYVKADYVATGSAAGEGAGSAASNPRSAVETVEPISSTLYISVIGCQVNVVPTDDEAVSCRHDASALRLSHETAQGVQRLTVQPRDGASSDAEATLCVPRGAYEQVTLDVKNGAGGMAGGLQCPAAVYGANARLSLTLASDAVHGYALHLIDSVCVFGIGETAQHYGILVENISGSTLTLTGDLPACQPGAASYAFTSGAGTAQIHVTGLLNSELEFIFVRA